MAKRKSFEEKNKHIHKSRQLVIDTVFGRTDDNQTTLLSCILHNINEEKLNIWYELLYINYNNLYVYIIIKQYINIYI